MKHREWRGDAYHSSRLLIIGESQYSWRENGRWVHPDKNQASESVKWITSEMGWNGPRTGARFRETLVRNSRKPVLRPW